MLLKLILLLLLIEAVFSKCSENICENIQDVQEKLLNKNWNFVHFQHWYPVRMVYLEQNTFKNYDKLEYITIKRLINGINEKSLSGLSKLHTIVFVDNILNTLPKNVFKGCPIEKIVIRNSKLQIIEENVFSNLETLTDLKIEKNNFREIKSGVFPGNLIELILSGNGIMYIEDNSFSNLTNLETLDLSDNYLTTFEFQRMLNNNYQLVNLNLSFNYLQKISKLPTLEKLKYLYLNNNTVSAIDDSSFQGCTNLEIINLSSNKIREISTKAFGYLKFLSLNKLYLSYNSLTCIENNFLKLFPNLKIIWVGMNPLKCECFKTMKIYLNNNNIKYPYNYDFEWKTYQDCL